VPDDDRPDIQAFLRRRDEASFLVLYRRHTPYLYRLALRLLGGRRADAEDAVQETWLRGTIRLAGFRGEAALRTWLAAITINCCRELMRRRQGMAESVDVEGTPSATIATDGERVDMERAIEALPNGYREVLVLHDMEGYTHEEIAQRLGIAEGTSKSQLSRARATLRGRLEGER
jgi:RNA polymerase sigma-70 factor (ECF subfamily)